MDRTATATIEGFNYQHNKSILEIIRANKTTKVMLEGCIEDIDIIDDDSYIDDDTDDDLADLTIVEDDELEE